ncbi:RabGAP/TBC [Piedraia hortae CBS 480.64]|uniref:GTPase-activating protein GYP5 n=1 Tax=Piedraia hortae CBS 480.64 TaxID=1314780 RepID=A0A6A7C5L8_9PEZI|nr:RabGAP/TBC [Piedraia hortae CBS 480.64]
MNSIRKARSPSAPRPEPKPSSDQLATEKVSLQDQFQYLRSQGEFARPEAEATPKAERKGGRRHSDLRGTSRPTDIPRPRLERSTTFSAVKSPPLNPTLPPGTASGLTAGPSEEQKPVNWDLWQALVYEGPSAVQKSSGAEMRAAIASGIPPAIRGVVWQVLAESKNEDLESTYRQLKARGPDTEEETSGSANSSPSAQFEAPHLETQKSEKAKHDAAALAKLEKAIRRDLGARTSYSKYTQSAELQEGLFGICKAYALYDEGVGYAQGINFISMPLLFNLAEEDAFTLLVRLMNKYGLRSMFLPDMSGLHLRLYQFERLLEDTDPALCCHLRRRQVGPELYATQWFLTLFAYRFPLQLVLRVYDLVFSEGLTAILKFGIVLLQRNRAALLDMKDMSQLTTFLKEKIFDVYIDKSPTASSLLDAGFFGSVTGGADRVLYRADEMVRDACNVFIPEKSLTAYASAWEEQQRTERMHAEELETLRTTNISLSARVKSLEERCQEQDKEHVILAGDLVKYKVENDRLMDENEELKVKVVELQKVVDAQPEEVEEKLRNEMDRIMKRNIEVQNENRNLKEEAEEMETELVNTKMQHAQVQADRDAIRKKLASVQSLLGR